MIELGINPDMLHFSKDVVGLSLMVWACFSVQQRKAMFKRAEGKCENHLLGEPCDRTFNEGFMLHAHHRKPRHMGGRDDTSNGIMVCIPHHVQAHLDLYEEFGKIEDLVAVRTLEKTPIHTRRFMEINRIKLPPARGIS